MDSLCYIATQPVRVHLFFAWVLTCGSCFFLEDFGLSVDPHPCGSRTAGPPNIRERERAPSDRRKKGGMELDSVLLNRWLSDGKCS